MGINLKEFFIHALNEGDEVVPGAGPTFSAVKTDPAAAQPATGPAFAQAGQPTLPAEAMNFFAKQNDAILGHLGELGQNEAVASGLSALLTGLDTAAYQLYTTSMDKQKFSENWSKAAAGIMSSFSGIGKSFESLAGKDVPKV